jgi:hypothetical protein
MDTSDRSFLSSSCRRKGVIAPRASLAVDNYKCSLGGSPGEISGMYNTSF